MAKKRGILVLEGDYVQANKLLNKAKITTWALIHSFKFNLLSAMIGGVVGAAIAVLICSQI